jgi:hypothetical protein
MILHILREAAGICLIVKMAKELSVVFEFHASRQMLQRI